MKRLNISVLKNLKWLSPNMHAAEVQHSFTNWICACMAGQACKWHLYRLLLVKSMGVCEKDCSSKAFSWVFFAVSASCFRICSSLDQIRFFMRNHTYIHVYLWTDIMNWIKKPQSGWKIQTPPPWFSMNTCNDVRNKGQSRN